MKPLEIITVDDEPHIHDGLDAIMDWSSLGCVHTLKAANGSEALSLIEKHRPDIILTDIKMPILDGIALIKKVREIDGYFPAVIIMSGYNDFAYAQAALRNKAADYLLKPIDEDELADCIRGIRSGPKAAISPAPSAGLVENRAAVSTVFRRIAMHSSEFQSADVLFLQKDPRVIPPFSFALLVPFSKIDGDGQAVHGGFLPDNVYRALVPLKDRIPVECLYREAFGSIGLLLTGGVLDPSLSSVELEIKGLHRIISPNLRSGAKLIAGNSVEFLGDVSKSRKSVLDFMSSTYVMHAPGIALASQGEKGIAREINRESVTLLMREVDGGNWDAAREHLDDFFALLKEGEVSAHGVRDWMLVLAYEVRRLFERMNGGTPENEQMFRAIAKNVEFIPYDEIVSHISMFIENVCEQVRALRVAVRHSNVVLIQRAVERRCADEITLGELAEDLKMNPVYLGQLFKQVIGKSFKDYQREIRIKEACRLLRETNERITEIAGLVGYQNYDYFVEQFKREMNTTPSSYRRN